MTDDPAVSSPPHGDTRLEQYVLGLLDEATQDAVEALAFGDAATAAAIDDVETRLVDAYVAGTLAGPQLDAFTRALASRPRLATRVRVARALLARPATTTPSSRWWLPILAAAAVIIVAGLWFVRQGTRPVEPPTQTAAGPRDTAASADTPQVPSPDAARPDPSSEPPRRPARVLFAVTLPGGVARAADTFVIRLPGNATHVQVRVPVAEGDDFARYRVRMVDARGQGVGVADPAPLSPDRTVWLTVERAALTGGLFDVEVEGLDAHGNPEPLTLQQVRINTEGPRQ
jgi:hypothetical protein